MEEWNDEQEGMKGGMEGECDDEQEGGLGIRSGTKQRSVGGSVIGGVRPAIEMIVAAEVGDGELLRGPEFDGVLEGPVLEFLAPGDGEFLLAEVAVVDEAVAVAGVPVQPGD